MRQKLGFRLLWCCLVFGFLPTGAAFAKTNHQLAIPEVEVDVVGDRDGTFPMPQKALQDTVWIADWSFDTGGPCISPGWTLADNRILNDGAVHWRVAIDQAGTGGIVGNSAILGYEGNLCCSLPDGYDNDWYQAIRMTYTGSATLSFDYLLDSDPGADFLRIETDSACTSFDRVDYTSSPNRTSGYYRTLEFTDSGLKLDGSIQNESLTNFGPGTHCVYIAFLSNFEESPCDGIQPTTIGAAMAIDDISITDAEGVRTEDFTDGDLDVGTFVNVHDSKPFGNWARLFEHISDNDLCTENATCAWLWTDYTTPTVANVLSMAFGPGGFVIRNWLDNSIVSPWASLAGTSNATGTVIQLRRFPGNPFDQSRIVQNWSVRGRKVAAGDTCISGWGHAAEWNSLDDFKWITLTFDMSSYFDPTASDLQIRHRTSDWQWIAGAAPPSPFLPGPGPYTDRTRIGRRILTGPVISEGVDARTQAQDCFPTEIHPGFPPSTGEHFRPTMDRFGTCAFSMGASLGRSFNLTTGDSIYVLVRDLRDAGGVTAIQWYGTIISGPHAGKAPAPWSVGANGFFVVPADSSRGSGGVLISDFYFVDLDDTYFRGGDVLHYFWLATDALGGLATDPIGITSVPASIEEAELETGGLLEVSFLPSINWSAAYLGRIASGPHGDLDPTPAELVESTQKNCMLYVQFVNFRRRSGDVNRTSFMYTLDRLGYRGSYDIYDHTGFGNTNNQIGGRATIEQTEGYNLIVYDAGNVSPSSNFLPDGSHPDQEKIDQVTWFRNWLTQASASEAGFATLWIVGSNVMEASSTSPLLNLDMGVLLATADQGLNLNPDVDGVVSFTFDQGAGQETADFTDDDFGLKGGCPKIRNYDGLAATGTAVVTHRYRSPVTQAHGDAAIVMNRSDSESWNTILQSHPWFDIVGPSGAAPVPLQPTAALLLEILNGTLPMDCREGLDPTDAGDPVAQIAVPIQTRLYLNIPNPLNPVTTIRFDLALAGRVSLAVYDVAGRLVRRLVDQPLPAGRNQCVVWNGLDVRERTVAGGVYFYRLEAAGFSETRKMIVLR